MAHTIDISFNASASQAQKDAVITAFARFDSTVEDEASMVTFLQGEVDKMVHQQEKKIQAEAYTPTDLTVS